MREILFRGKRAWNEEWVEGWFVGKTCDSLFGPARGSAQIIDQDLLWHEVMPETVGQYTGLKDKNGKRIFEGDVVKMFYKDDFCEIGPVMWSDIGARCKFAPPVGAAYNIDCTCVMEIVGNIHDNPELLKGEGK